MKEEIKDRLISQLDAYGILYEDVSDDGDGKLELTELGEAVVEFIFNLLEECNE